MSQIKFQPPSKSEPGFLRRQKTVLSLAKRLKSEDYDPALIDEMVAFLLPYVIEPTDRLEATEALMDASEEQFDSLLSLVGGQTSPLAGSKPS